MMKVPDYDTPKKKKRFVESELRRKQNAVEKVKAYADVEKYMDGVYGKCRQKAILNYLDRAEAEFKGFGLVSIVESFVANELMIEPPHTRDFSRE